MADYDNDDHISIFDFGGGKKKVKKVWSLSYTVFIYCFITDDGSQLTVRDATNQLGCRGDTRHCWCSYYCTITKWRDSRQLQSLHDASQTESPRKPCAEISTRSSIPKCSMFPRPFTTLVTLSASRWAFCCWYAIRQCHCLLFDSITIY